MTSGLSVQEINSLGRPVAKTLLLLASKNTELSAISKILANS